jgi:hypothetical protein
LELGLLFVKLSVKGGGKNVEPMIGTVEAAKRLGITPNRVAVFCEEGRIEGAQKIGKTWVIPPASLEKLPRKRTGRPTRRQKMMEEKELLQKAIDSALLKKNVDNSQN